MSRTGHFQQGAGGGSTDATDYFDGVEHNAPSNWGRTKSAGWTEIHPDDELVATQREIDPRHAAFTGQKMARGPAPSVVDDGGVLYVNDGHHRLAAARQQGRSIKARLHYATGEW
jgi:hypothetical protein